jgi:hypothetical protein
MRPKLAAAALVVGIVALSAGTARVATLSSSGSTAGTIERRVSAGSPRAESRKIAPRRTVAPVTRSRTGGTGTSTSTTNPAPQPPSTTFVVSTITYAVKRGDTVSTIERWFEQHGYGVEFTANLLVIESNKTLLVPGALVSLTNGVMTIESPA